MTYTCGWRRQRRVSYRMMQAVARRSVRYIRDTIRRTRTLWKGRQRASLVDSAAGHGVPPLHGTEPSAGWHVGRAGGLRLVEPCVQRPGQHDPLVSSHALCQQVAQDPAEKRDVTFHQAPLSVRLVLVCVRERRHAISHEAGAPGFAIRRLVNAFTKFGLIVGSPLADTPILRSRGVIGCALARLRVSLYGGET